MTEPLHRINDIVTFADCRDRTDLIITYTGDLVKTPELCCDHENFPFVIFPKGSGHKDPLYCRVARESGKCPRGFR